MSSVMSWIANSMPALPNLADLPKGWVWAGIVLCILQSAMFSGLNLAAFSLSQLRLQIEADGGNADAARVLNLRKNSNQVLAITKTLYGALQCPRGALFQIMLDIPRKTFA